MPSQPPLGARRSWAVSGWKRCNERERSWHGLKSQPIFIAGMAKETAHSNTSQRAVESLHPPNASTPSMASPPSPPSFVCGHARPPQALVAPFCSCSQTFDWPHPCDGPGGRVCLTNRTPAPGSLSVVFPPSARGVLRSDLDANPCSNTFYGPASGRNLAQPSQHTAPGGSTTQALKMSLLRGRQQRPSAGHPSMTTSTTGAVSTTAQQLLQLV